MELHEMNFPEMVAEIRRLANLNKSISFPASVVVQLCFLAELEIKEHGLCESQKAHTNGYNEGYNQGHSDGIYTVKNGMPF